MAGGLMPAHSTRCCAPRTRWPNRCPPAGKRKRRDSPRKEPYDDRFEPFAAAASDAASFWGEAPAWPETILFRPGSTHHITRPWAWRAAPACFTMWVTTARTRSTLKGLCERAIIAVLLGCALRGSAVAALTMGHVQQRDGRWCIVDLVGKHNRVRTVPMPAWVKVGIDAWPRPARVVDGSCSVPSTAATRSRVRCCPKRWSRSEEHTSEL